jgi:hypothetical protein
MKVLNLKNVVRKDSPIYYRRIYSGAAVLDMMGRQVDCRLEWTVETTPFGTSSVTLNSVDDVDYPKIPLQKALKDYITELDRNGGLPV